MTKKLMNISIRAIRYFVATCELGSLSKAAEHLRISNSAISLAITSMEEEFGVQLIFRQRAKGITLSPAGREILVNAKHLLEEYEHFVSRGNNPNSRLRGTLRVGYFAPVSPSFLPVIIKPLIENGEDIHVELVEGNNEQVQDGLRHGTYDVAIFLDYVIRPEIAWKSLLEIPPYLLVPKKHKFAKRKSVAFSELDGEDLVILNLPSTLEYYTSMLKRIGINPNVIVGATSVEAVRSLVSSGLGCSVLNMKPNCDLTYFGAEVACVPLSDQPDRTLELVIGYMPGQLRSLTQAFIDNCCDYFQSDNARQHKVIMSE